MPGRPAIGFVASGKRARTLMEHLYTIRDQEYFLCDREDGWPHGFYAEYAAETPEWVDDVSDLREVSSRNVTVLGEPARTVSYAGTAEVDGERIGVVVDVTVVEHGEDVVIALGIYGDVLDDGDSVHRDGFVLEDSRCVSDCRVLNVVSPIGHMKDGLHTDFIGRWSVSVFAAVDSAPSNRLAKFRPGRLEAGETDKQNHQRKQRNERGDTH